MDYTVTGRKSDCGLQPAIQVLTSTNQLSRSYEVVAYKGRASDEEFMHQTHVSSKLCVR